MTAENKRPQNNHGLMEYFPEELPAHELVAKLTDCDALFEKLEAENQRLLSAIKWATGCNGDFEKPEGSPPYWWRLRLVELAGLEYDGKKFVLKERT